MAETLGWCGFGLVCLSRLYFTRRDNTTGFAVAIVGDFVWLVYGLTLALWSLVATDALLLVVDLNGWWRCRQDGA